MLGLTPKGIGGIDGLACVRFIPCAGLFDFVFLAGKLLMSFRGSWIHGVRIPFGYYESFRSIFAVGSVARLRFRPDVYCRDSGDDGMG